MSDSQDFQVGDTVYLSVDVPKRLRLFVENPCTVLEVKTADNGHQLIKLPVRSQSEAIKKAFNFPEEAEDWFDSAFFHF